MKEQTQIKKTSFGLKIAYSFGQVTDSVPFNLFFIYFLFFFTDIAGLSPAVGGVICLLIVLWDAITDPIIGFVADRSKSKYGRRRPFMLGALVPLFVLTILLFTTVDFGSTMTYVYYVIIGMLLWTAYTFYVVPFSALGAELTQHFTDRNNLRTVAGFFIYLTVWAVTALPMLIWDKVAIAGGSDQLAWVISAAVLGAIGLLSGLICWNFTRGKELATGSDIVKDAQTEVNYKFFKNYFELIQQKPIRSMVFVMIFLCTSFAIASAALVYLMSNNLGLSETTQAFYWTCYTVITFAVIPLSNICANKFGKRNALILLNVLTVLGCLYYYFVGINNFTDLLIYSAIFQLGNTSLWILGFSLGYDCVEVDEFLHGYRREGAITSLLSFSQKLGSALGMWICGILLTFFNYDGTLLEQAAEAEKGILILNTVAPAIAVALGIAALLLYPITEKNYLALLEATELKKEGKPYNTEGFEKLIK